MNKIQVIIGFKNSLNDLNNEIIINKRMVDFSSDLQRLLDDFIKPILGIQDADFPIPEQMALSVSSLDN
jgi:hypothetical protein